MTQARQRPGRFTPVASIPSTGSRLSGIEGMRAIAAWSIVLIHIYGFGTPGGAIGENGWIGAAFSMLSSGVTLFFTLSGFLLYRPFAAAIARGVPLMSIRSYFRNRFLRIAPAYWVILACTSLLGMTYVRDATGVLHVQRMDVGSFIGAALLIQDYRPATVLNGIGPAWSLAVEVVFYLLLPLLALAAARRARTAPSRRDRVRVLLWPPLFLLLLGLSGKFATQLLPGGPTEGFNGDWHSVIERSFWAQADLFSFGMVVAVLYTEVVDRCIALPAQWRRIAVTLGVVVLVPCALTMNKGELSYLPQNTGVALALALFFAAIIVPNPEGTSSRTVRWLERPWIVAAGTISYSVFLWHFPLIVWMQPNGLTFPGWSGLILNLLIVSVIVAVLSTVTHRFVELPGLRRKRATRDTDSFVVQAAP